MVADLKRNVKKNNYALTQIDAPHARISTFSGINDTFLI
jgi:hypothetical protein